MFNLNSSYLPTVSASIYMQTICYHKILSFQFLTNRHQSNQMTPVNAFITSFHEDSISNHHNLHFPYTNQTENCSPFFPLKHNNSHQFSMCVFVCVFAIEISLCAIFHSIPFNYAATTTPLSAKLHSNIPSFLF